MLRFIYARRVGFPKIALLPRPLAMLLHVKKKVSMTSHGALATQRVDPTRPHKNLSAKDTTGHNCGGRLSYHGYAPKPYSS